MTATSPPSTDVVTTQQRTGWGCQARTWYSLHELIERQWSPLSEGLLRLASVGPGDRVVDLASGVGDPAIAAARLVGPTGTVVATDLSPDMIAFAAQRAAAERLRQVEVHEMDAAAIDLPDASADVVLCRLGLMFVPDLDRVLTGVRDLLVPGGRFATVIPWQPAGTAVAALVAALVGSLGVPAPPPPAPGRPGIFSLADASIVCAALERAGLSGIRVEPVTVRHEYRSAEEWLDFVLALNIPLRQQLESVPGARLAAARAAAIEAAAAHVDEDGAVRFPGHYYYVTAIRPAAG
jgi:enediyne biosynthesis protein CalE5